MKESALALLIFTAATSFSFGVELYFVDNGPVAYEPDLSPDLHSYTLTASGIGINNMSMFQINNPVWQYLPESEWLGDGSAQTLYDRDSYVIFGDMRIPDLGGAAWDYVNYPDGPPDHFTQETFYPPDTSDALGTLNNYFSDGVNEFYDSYIIAGPPSTTYVTHELMQLLVPEEDFYISGTVRLSTYTEYEIDPVSGDLSGGTVDVQNYDFAFSQVLRPDLGDTDVDGDIDFDDFVNFSAGWFGPDGREPTNATPAAEWFYGDFDADGDVDFQDFVFFSGSTGVDGWFGPCGDVYIPPVSSIPEPCTIWMLLAGGLWIFKMRYRRAAN